MLCVFASDAALTDNCPVGPISALSSLKTPPPTTTKQQARTKLCLPLAPTQKQPSYAVLPFLSRQLGSVPFEIRYFMVCTCPLSEANTRGERQVNRDTIAKLADARMGKAIQNNPLRRAYFTQPLERTTTGATRYREPLNSIPANHHSPLRTPHLFDPHLTRSITHCCLAVHLSFSRMWKKTLMLNLPWKR